MHIILALAAIALSVFANFKPSADKLKSSYILAVGTLATGVLLIFVNQANVLRTCLTGIAFFAVVSLLNELARHKLVISTAQNRDR